MGRPRRTSGLTPVGTAKVEPRSHLEPVWLGTSMAYEAGPPRARKAADFGYSRATSGPATAAGPDEDRLVRLATTPMTIPMTIRATIHERRIAEDG